jgi:hypothetical protein
MSIWITGDVHIPIDIKKITSRYWIESKHLTKNDYLIVCGDFGLLWNNIEDNEETYWKEWLNKKNWTTLFIDGNHENHYRLNRLKEVDMFGSKVGKVSDSIFHLKRGHIYIIENEKFFCMGGALSLDKLHRIEGLSWWREEKPSYLEMNIGLENLEKNNNEVDYIISHTLPQNLTYEIGSNTHIGHVYYDTTCQYLQHIYDTINFKKGYCGHWHMDCEVGKFQILYYDVVKIK